MKNRFLYIVLVLLSMTIGVSAQDSFHTMFPTEYFYIVDGKRIAQEIIRDFSK